MWLLGPHLAAWLLASTHPHLVWQASLGEFPGGSGNSTQPGSRCGRQRTLEGMTQALKQGAVGRQADIPAPHCAEPGPPGASGYLEIPPGAGWEGGHSRRHTLWWRTQRMWTCPGRSGGARALPPCAPGPAADKQGGCGQLQCWLPPSPHPRASSSP